MKDEWAALKIRRQAQSAVAHSRLSTHPQALEPWPVQAQAGCQFVEAPRKIQSGSRRVRASDEIVIGWHVSLNAGLSYEATRPARFRAGCGISLAMTNPPAAVCCELR
ncbi:hypothetical protein L1887_53001 [Cichorium endivia]|nr:hypothetical protein L1887_53001 [Cichorium endivia]